MTSSSATAAGPPSAEPPGQNQTPPMAAATGTDDSIERRDRGHGPVTADGRRRSPR
ncbi:MAG: hypothetical protein R2695_03645 [Acidimicrobiales bacterium]